MKILLLTPEYPPQPCGGIGTSTQQLARGLVAAGHQVWVVSLGPDLRLDDRGVKVEFHDVTHPRGLGWLVVRRALGRAVRRIVDSEGVDVVVAPDWLGLSAGLRAACPILVNCNGSATYFGDLLDVPVRRHDRLAERIAVRRADGVGAVSRFTAERTQSLFSLPRCPTVVHNGVDLTRFSEPMAAGEPDLVVHLGTIVRKKGVLDLTQAFSRVVEVRASARLLVAGRDRPDASSGAPSTWALARANLSQAAQDAASWSGPVDQAAVGDLIARAAVCVFPSHAEANPVTWIEAMAGGRAIVGYAHPWAEEVVDHGVTGWLVPPGDIDALADAIVDALRDPDRLEAFGRRARAVAVEQFGIDTAVSNSIRWYEQAAAQRSARTVGRR